MQVALSVAVIDGDDAGDDHLTRWTSMPCQLALPPKNNLDMRIIVYYCEPHLVAALHADPVAHGAIARSIASSAMAHAIPQNTSSRRSA